MALWLWLWGLMAGAFAFGYILRGLFALRDVREVDELRQQVAALRLQNERDLAALERQWERS